MERKTITDPDDETGVLGILLGHFDNGTGLTEDELHKRQVKNQQADQEWFDIGAKFLNEWDNQIIKLGGAYPLSSNERDAYMLAWEQAGREAGVIK